MSDLPVDAPAVVEDVLEDGEPSEEPALASVDLDEDDGVGGAETAEGEGAEGADGADLTSEIEALERMINSAEATNGALVAAQKSAMSEVLAKGGAGAGAAAADDGDARSVFVSEVDFAVTAPELVEQFKACGDIEKVTLLKDKITFRPKGCVRCLCVCSCVCMSLGGCVGGVRWVSVC